MIFRNLIYILQSEYYDTGRFLRYAYTHPWWWHLERRGKIRWTRKSRVLYTLSLSISLSLALFGFLFFGGYGWLTLCLIVVASPLPISFSAILLSPVDWFLKKRTIATARAVVERSNAKVIGITGSYGKTSMKEILSALLEGSFVVVKTPENINTDIGVADFILANQEGILGAEVLIVEMGAHGLGDIQALCDLVRPQYSILTGIGEAHLERFGSMENIVRGKFELPHATRLCALFNIDNSPIREALAVERSSIMCEVVAVSSEGATAIEPLENFAGLSFVWQGERFSTQLLGRHTITLLVLGMTLARKLGVPLDRLRERVAGVAPVAHRLQPIRNSVTDVWVLDDSYNGNRDGALSALEVLSRAKGRKVVLTPGLVELGESSERIHRELAAEYMRVADEVLLIRSDATEFMEAYFAEKGYTGLVMYGTTAEAHADLAQVLQRGDTILFQNDLSDNYF